VIFALKCILTWFYSLMASKFIIFKQQHSTVNHYNLSLSLSCVCVSVHLCVCVCVCVCDP